MIREPTARELEIFRLRCQGWRYAAIAAELGIGRPAAGLMAAAAASKLIRSEPTVDNAGDRALALAHFPKIAKRLAEPPPPRRLVAELEAER